MVPTISSPKKVPNFKSIRPIQGLLTFCQKTNPDRTSPIILMIKLIALQMTRTSVTRMVRCNDSSKSTHATYTSWVIVWFVFKARGREVCSIDTEPKVSNCVWSVEIFVFEIRYVFWLRETLKIFLKIIDRDISSWGLTQYGIIMDWPWLHWYWDT